MKNHFFFPYFGNKRNEVERLYEIIEPFLDEIDTVIEPYCGSFAFSYYVWTLNKERNLKYILNDIDENLIMLIRTVIENPDYLNEINDEINEFKTNWSKTTYDEIVKKRDFKGYLLGSMYYRIRPNLFNINGCIDKILMSAPVVDFLLNANIEVKNQDGLNLLISNINNHNALIFLDPPYILSDNTMYKSSSDNIYSYFAKNDLKNFESKLVICIEKNFITDLIFDNENDNIITYDKKYANGNKKRTKHLIYFNRLT